jgi:hypothetical protein
VRGGGERRGGGGRGGERGAEKRRPLPRAGSDEISIESSLFEISTQLAVLPTLLACVRRRCGVWCMGV